MKSQPQTNPASVDNEARWNAALDYFRSRRAVVFLNQGRFWERHAFSQQSLAKHLVRNGVEVIWFDGIGWRPYRPTYYFNSPLLEVRQLPQLPGCRFPSIERMARRRQKSLLLNLIRRKGDNPVIWVQDGLPETLAAQLPYVDVFSLFDNPYSHQPDGPLCHRARMLLAQNSYAGRLITRYHPDKSQVAYPALDMGPEAFERTDLVYKLPAGFPSPVVGCVGSFMNADYDLDLFEVFVDRFPKLGFVLMGRTDEAGRKHVARLSRRKNCLVLPWVPRSQVAPVWRALSCTLLFYRSFRWQDGGFPTRALESSFFGVPCIATRVPQTHDLEGFVPRSNYVDELENAMQAILSGEKSGNPQRLLSHYADEMNPKLHLIRVAEFLSRAKATSRI